MWFSSKGKSYKLNYAESLDVVNMKELKTKGITKSINKEADSEMIEYASIIKISGL